MRQSHCRQVGKIRNLEEKNEEKSKAAARTEGPITTVFATIAPTSIRSEAILKVNDYG
jgi:hypothetical protein